VFRIQVISNPDVRSPIITLGSTSFFHTRVNNLYLVAVTKSVRCHLDCVVWGADDMSCRTNANAALVFEYLYRFTAIARSYFGKVDEESVKNNFVLIYELIDGMLLDSHWYLCAHACAEIIDFGYPQNSEIDTLKSYITTESVVSTSTDAVSP
jgi:AP-2 complex subunit mu-1